MPRQLDDKTHVSGQIRPDEVAGLAGLGITMLVNNRPDGEEPGQPLGTEIEEAARAAGIDYRSVPIIRGIGPADADAMQDAIKADEGQDAGLLPHGHSIGALPGPWPRARKA